MCERNMQKSTKTSIRAKIKAEQETGVGVGVQRGNTYAHPIKGLENLERFLCTIKIIPLQGIYPRTHLCRESLHTTVHLSTAWLSLKTLRSTAGKPQAWSKDAVFLTVKAAGCLGKVR